MVHNPSDDEIIQDSDDLSQAFLDQINEDLTMIENTFIEINDGNEDEEQLAEVMRVLHSQKGASGALCYTVIMKALHQMEEYLVSWQKEMVSFDLDFLLTKVDLIRKTSAIAMDASLSRSQFLNEYEKLRESLRTAHGDSKKILVIDSLQATSLLLKGYLQKKNFEVVSCNDGYVGLGQLLHDSFSAVICGGMVMGIDGPALVAAIKLNSTTESIPVVLVTSNARKKLVVEPDYIAHRNESDFAKIADWLEEKVKETQLAS